MLTRRLRVTALAGVVAMAVAACVNLDIINPNEPDRERALAEAGDVEALIAGSFASLYRGLHGQECTIQMFPVLATEFTATDGACGTHLIVFEPRFPLDNNVVIGGGAGPWGPRHFLADLVEGISSLNDGLQTVKARGGTLQVGATNVAPRAQAFAKLMQGWIYGIAANTYDQTYFITEDMPVGVDPVAQGREILEPYPSLAAKAVEFLDQARTLAQAGNLIFPANYLGTPQAVSTAQFVQLANTLAARTLVLNARNPAERKQVDWNRVLTYTAGGLTSNIEVQLAPGGRTSLLYQQTQSLTGFRMDNRLVGQADVSGNYQRWNSTAQLSSRTPFTIQTPDRRIQGPAVGSDGAYVRFRSDDTGQSGPQVYLYSRYQWARHAHRNNVVGTGETASNTGRVFLVTADENRLLRAEALLRLNRLQEAADLINVSRTRSHRLPDGVTYEGLPPVTAAGVPQSATCVPRTDSGACGDLMVALRYERMIELAATDVMRGWLDGRGFGLLPDGTFEQAALNGTELDVLGLPVYTFGGGFPFSAIYRPVTIADR
jgi:starch-binding outer membrane protein, SusD/RagB family